MDNQTSKIETKKEEKISSGIRQNKIFIIGGVVVSSLVIIYSFNYLKNSLLGYGGEHPRRSKKPRIVEKSYKGGAYILEGVIYDTDTPLVIINGEVLGKDDQVGSLIVSKISPNSVQLLDIQENKSIEISF
jgi:hypothetical protein